MKWINAGVLVALLSVSFGAYAEEIIPPLPLSSAQASAAILAPALSLAPLPHVRGGAFDLRFVNVGQLVDLLYSDAMHIPHVISSDVLQDSRVVSFQYDGKSDELREFVKVFLDSMGFSVETKDGVDFVNRKMDRRDEDDERQTFVYRPRYRSADYLSKLVQPLFSGRIAAPPDSEPQQSSRNAGVGVPVAPLSASAVLGTSGMSALNAGRPSSIPASISAADELVFRGQRADIHALEKVLPELDTPPGEVVVRGWVYEVSNTNSSNSAFSIAAHILDGQLGISNGAASIDATALTFDAHFLNVAISALTADTRFKEISDPHVRVLSGDKVELNVGSQVPTLGSVSFQGTGGTPVQSVDYQNAGVIFEVQPTVMSDSIEIKLDEQISSFVPTTTGVNNSPTKNTREMNTTVSMKDGEVVVLGGLMQDSDTATQNSEGWLPSFLDGRSSTKGRTEVLLVLQVQRVAAS